MNGTIGKWTGVSVPTWWTPEEQDSSWNNPEEIVYLFTTSKNKGRADWYEISFEMGFSEEKEGGYCVKMPLKEALKGAECCGWIIGPHWGLPD